MLETTIELNGSAYTLCYDWEAQVQAEKLTGVNLLMPPPTSVGFRAILLSRLLAKHPDMTVEKVNLLLPMNTAKISDALHSIGEDQELIVEGEVPVLVKEPIAAVA